MKTKQQKIDAETDAVAVLAVFLRFQSVERQGLIWSKKMVGQAAVLSESRTTVAFEWLENRSYIACHLQEYLVTDAGHDYYDGICKRPTHQTDRKFKDEVLTGGYVRKGRLHQTGLINAALPGTAPPHREDSDPEKIFAKNQQQLHEVNMVAAQLGVTTGQYSKLFKAGRIRLCNGGGVPHAGIFDRNGKGWRSKCRICRKK